MKRLLGLGAWFAALSLCAAPVPEDAKTAAADGSFVRAVKALAKFCTLQFRIDEKAKDDRALLFEYRVSAPGAYQAAVCMGASSARMTYTPLPPAARWRQAVVPLKKLAYSGSGDAVAPGTRFRKLSIYVKHTGSPAAEGELKLELRKVRFETYTGPSPFKFPHTVGEADLQTDSPHLDVSFADGVWSATSKVPQKFTTLEFRLDMPFRPDIVCELEYRVKANGASVAYAAVNFFRQGKAGSFHQLGSSPEWTRGTIRFAPLRQYDRGEKLPRMSIYAKLAEGPLAGTPTIEVRNIRFTLDPDYDPLAGVRVSYSAYPLFDWPEAKDAAGYCLRYGGRSVETKEPFFVPAEPVAPGVIEYTASALPSGKVLRKDILIVPERTLKWRLPEYAFQAFARLPHPRFRTLAEKFWMPSAEAVLAQARECAAYAVPADPAPYIPGADPAITSWIVWHGKIAGGVIARTGDRMVILGRAAILTGDPEWKKAAREKLLAALKWNPLGASHKRFADLQSAWLLRGLCWCYDAAYDLLSPEERAEATKIIRIRGDQFYASCHPFQGNEAQNHSWDWAEAAGLAALTLAEEPDMETRYRFLASLYAYRFFPSLGFEGENNEGLSYWIYGLGLALRFVDEARYTLGLNFYTQPWLMRTARFPMYCLPPRGFSVSFADSGMPNHSGPARASLNPPTTGKLAASAGDPEALWYAGRPEGDGVTAKIPLDIPQSRSYAHIGVTVFNTFLPDGRENVQVGFHSGKYFAGHQHADQNHFVINAYGDKLAVDGGYYDWWGSRHFREYSVQSVAHNTILADGKGQDWIVSGSDGATTRYFDSANFGFVSGDAKKVYQKRVSRFKRDLLFVKPDCVFVFDRLAAPKPTVFSWLMHSHTDSPMAHDGADFAIARPLAGLVGSVLLPRDVKTKVEPAYTVMPVNGYSDDPVANRQKEWLFSASNAAPVSATEFLAAMRIVRGPGAAVEKSWTLEENADAVLVRGGNTEVLFNRHPGKRVALGNFATDARCAAVVLADGKVADWVKLGGTFFQYKEARCGEPGDRAGIERNRTTESASIPFCGATVPVTRHTVRFASGRAVHVLEGILDVPEDGTYTLQSGTPAHYILAQFPKGRHAAQRVAPDAPVRLELIRGKLVFCVSSDRPLTAVELVRQDR